MYNIYLSKRVENFLEKLDKQIKSRIEKRLKNLERDPVPKDSKFLGRDKGEKLFRYRIGKYRVLYKIKEKMEMVLITKIDKRSRVYK